MSLCWWHLWSPWYRYIAFENDSCRDDWLVWERRQCTRCGKKQRREAQ